jgi:hypothetical protein
MKFGKKTIVTDWLRDRKHTRPLQVDPMLKYISEDVTLTGIDLSTVVAMDEVCDKLKSNENLKSLSLRATNLSDSAMEVLAHYLSENGKQLKVKLGHTKRWPKDCWFSFSDVEFERESADVALSWQHCQYYAHLPDWNFAHARK